MDAVLGLSVTTSAVGVVVVDGPAAGGATCEGEAFAVCTSQATGAVRRAEQLAADRGRRLHSIGVTWSDEAEADAAQLLEALSDAGFPNVVEVRLPEATEALARELAALTDYPTTAVCVIEPGQLVALVVHAAEGAVQTAVNHTAVTEDDLIDWLGAVFAMADRAPGALVLVGSAEDLDGLAPVLQDALAVPVFAPAEAALAVARGAAAACVQTAKPRWSIQHETRKPHATPSRARRFGAATPAAMLAGGMVAFVASASAALTLQFSPGEDTERASSGSSAQVPAALTRPVPPLRPPVTAPVADSAASAALPDDTVEVAPIAEALPIVEAEPIVDAVPPAPPVPELPVVLEAPPELPEVLPPPAVPQEQPGLMQRIRDRLAGLGDGQPEAPPQPPPAPVVPPPAQ